jgi:ABC-2 type transport system permease protein
MRKVWTVFIHEYTRHVLRRRFIFALLSVPLWIMVSIGAGLLSVVVQNNPKPVGYVDQSGILTGIDLNSISEDRLQPVAFVEYGSEEAGRAALEAKEIQAYFFLPENYRETLESRLVFFEEPNQTVRSQFADGIRAGWLKDQDPRIARRLLEGASLQIEATQEESAPGGQLWFKIAAPIAAAVMLIVSVFTSTGYLMQAVVEEKENRTMELLATSLSPMQIMGSKILALISVGLTQVMAWGFFPLLALLLVSAYFPFLTGIVIDWKLIGLIIATAVPTFILISSLMAAIGVTVTESREGQQVSTLVTLPVMAPFMLISVIMSNPNGVIAIALSLFPLTAAMTLLLRMAFATVPGWQIGVSLTLLILSAFGSLWLAGRIFRLGMLRYGKRMGWKDVFQAITLRPAVARKETSVHG